MKRIRPLNELANDAAFVGQAKRYAMLLAANHGLQYPAFVEVVRRIDEHLDRLLELERYQTKSNFMHGEQWKPKAK